MSTIKKYIYKCNDPDLDLQTRGELIISQLNNDMDDCAMRGSVRVDVHGVVTRGKHRYDVAGNDYLFVVTRVPVTHVVCKHSNRARSAITITVSVFVICRSNILFNHSRIYLK